MMTSFDCNYQNTFHYNANFFHAQAILHKRKKVNMSILIYMDVTKPCEKHILFGYNNVNQGKHFI